MGKILVNHDNIYQRDCHFIKKCIYEISLENKK